MHIAPAPIFLPRQSKHDEDDGRYEQQRHADGGGEKQQFEEAGQTS
jgi:hypothetical protein